MHFIKHHNSLIYFFFLRRGDLENIISKKMNNTFHPSKRRTRAKGWMNELHGPHHKPHEREYKDATGKKSEGDVGWSH